MAELQAQFPLSEEELAALSPEQLEELFQRYMSADPVGEAGDFGAAVLTNPAGFTSLMANLLRGMGAFDQESVIEGVPAGPAPGFEDNTGIPGTQEWAMTESGHDPNSAAALLGYFTDLPTDGINPAIFGPILREKIFTGEVTVPADKIATDRYETGNVEWLRDNPYVEFDDALIPMSPLEQDLQMATIYGELGRADHQLMASKYLGPDPDPPPFTDVWHGSTEEWRQPSDDFKDFLRDPMAHGRAISVKFPHTGTDPQTANSFAGGVGSDRITPDAHISPLRVENPLYPVDQWTGQDIAHPTEMRRYGMRTDDYAIGDELVRKAVMNDPGVAKNWMRGARLLGNQPYARVQGRRWARVPDAENDNWDYLDDDEAIAAFLDGEALLDTFTSDANPTTLADLLRRESSKFSYLTPEEQTEAAIIGSERLKKEGFGGLSYTNSVDHEIAHSISPESVVLTDRDSYKFKLKPGFKKTKLNAEAELISDGGSDEWLARQREKSDAAGRDEGWEMGGKAPRLKMGETTATARSIAIPTSKLKGLKGLNQEQINQRSESLEWQRGNVRFKNGNALVMRRQDDGSLKEEVHRPYIWVDQDGDAWIANGNHRIMEAVRRKVPYVNVELRYLNGAENVDGPWSFKALKDEEF